MATKRKKSFVARCLDKLKKAGIGLPRATAICGSLAPKRKVAYRLQHLIWDPNLPHYGGKGRGGWIPVAQSTYEEHHGKKKIVRRKRRR